MNIVLDTNIYLSALLFQGRVATLYDAIIEEHDVFISPFILSELTGKLVSKFKLTPAIVSQITESILMAVVLVRPKGLVPDNCKDPDDNNILHLADWVQADYIITGDKDLWELKKYKHTLIVRPSDFTKV